MQQNYNSPSIIGNNKGANENPSILVREMNKQGIKSWIISAWYILSSKPFSGRRRGSAKCNCLEHEITQIKSSSFVALRGLTGSQKQEKQNKKRKQGKGNKGWLWKGGRKGVEVRGVKFYFLRVWLWRLFILVQFSGITVCIGRLCLLLLTFSFITGGFQMEKWAFSACVLTSG